MNKEFEVLRQWWSEDSKRDWREAYAFFSDPARHQFLKEWRNDVGGHFHDSAAQYAIDNIHHGTISTVRFALHRAGAEFRMPFAYELVAVAMTKNKEHQETEEQFMEAAFTFFQEAVVHAVKVIRTVVMEALYPKFGK